MKPWAGTTTIGRLYNYAVNPPYKGLKGFIFYFYRPSFLEASYLQERDKERERETERGGGAGEWRSSEILEVCPQHSMDILLIAHLAHRHVDNQVTEKLNALSIAELSIARSRVLSVGNEMRVRTHLCAHPV